MLLPFLGGSFFPLQRGIFLSYQVVEAARCRHMSTGRPRNPRSRGTATWSPVKSQPLLSTATQPPRPCKGPRAPAPGPFPLRGCWRLHARQTCCCSVTRPQPSCSAPGKYRNKLIYLSIAICFGFFIPALFVILGFLCCGLTHSSSCFCSTSAAAPSSTAQRLFAQGCPCGGLWLLRGRVE